MAAVFPLDTSKPWAFNGVTYEYDAGEDRWYVVSSAASEEVVDELSQLENRVESTENETHNNTDRIEDLENASTPDGVSQEYVDDGLALKVDKSDYDNDYQAVLDGFELKLDKDDYEADKQVLQDALDDKVEASDLATKVSKDGDTMTGRLLIERPRTGANSNSFIIKGRVDGVDGSILFKDYQRQSSNLSNDYIEYYGDVVGDNSIINRGYANTNYLKLSGGTLTGNLSGQLIKSTRDTGYAFEVKPNDSETLAYIHTSGKIKTPFLLVASELVPDTRSFEVRGELADGTEDSANFFYSYTNVAGSADAVNYNGKTSSDKNIQTKESVESLIANSGVSAVPTGSIMIWLNSSPPSGWFKLHGGSFDINAYPQLHAYLSNTGDYSSGTLPDWSGHYPGEYGGHLTENLNTKVTQRTAQPNGGPPQSSSDTIPTGNTRTFAASGGTNAYSNGQSRVTIDNGWDNKTRPDTVVVHYIIKHDQRRSYNRQEGIF